MKQFLFFVVLFFSGLSAQAQSPAATPVQKPTQSEKGVKVVTLMSLLNRAGLFDIFISAIKDAGYEDKLKQGTFTVLAPRDAAFAHVDSVARDMLFKSKSNLKRFVEQHLIEGRHDLDELGSVDEIVSVAGVTLPIEHKEPLEIGQAKILKSESDAENGVVLMLDKALLIEP